MNKQDIHLLYQYNRWVNARILGAAAKIRCQIARSAYALANVFNAPEKLRFSLERVLKLIDRTLAHDAFACGSMVLRLIGRHFLPPAGKKVTHKGLNPTDKRSR